MTKTQINYKLPGHVDSLQLEAGEAAFTPTATSDFLIKGCQKGILIPGSLLDLGCGIGIVGIALKYLGCVSDLSASDLSENATALCKRNALSYGMQANVRCGDGFEPWTGCRFDYIVDDISGVAEDIAKVSTWFRNVPCNSGKDGTRLVVNVINDARSHLTPGGKLFFPIISLSSAERILSAANRNFSTVQRLSSNQWFLPDDLSGQLETLARLKDEGHISYQDRFGKIICSTDIYVASN